jgi:DNA-binding transcriptional ArsR family regulator
MEGLPDAALEQVATYFQTLSEPTRLKILNVLQQSERSVRELAQLCGYTSANISRHLALLTAQGLVARERRGTSAYYRIADASVYALCDLVCNRVARLLDYRANERQLLLHSPSMPDALRTTRSRRPA